MLSLSVITYYSALMLCESEADKGLLWRIEITELIVFAFVPIFAVSLDCVFISKTADRSIVPKVCGVGIYV